MPAIAGIEPLENILVDHDVRPDEDRIQDNHHRHSVGVRKIVVIFPGKKQVGFARGPRWRWNDGRGL